MLWLTRGDEGLKMFIVIEGDNGTGKTTLGELFRHSGFEFVNRLDEAGTLEAEAKKFAPGSLQRHEAFLKYNKFCGNYASSRVKAVLVRYWFSTLTAAFADGLFEFDYALKLSESLYSSMPKPDYVFRLYCGYSARKERILRRRQSDDDISQERDERYRLFSDALGGKISRWYNIDTTKLTLSQTCTTIRMIIGG